MRSSRSSRRSAGWKGPAQLILRLVLMGVGLGLLTGSSLRLLAPRVQQQEIALPSWLADQALITTLLGDAVEPPSTENASGKKTCLLYTSPSPRDLSTSRMPSSA